VYATVALIGVAAADLMTQAEGLEGFLEVASQPALGLDLTFGRSSILLSARS